MYFWLTFLLFIFNTLHIQAQAYKTYDEGTVHEAFITRTGESIAVDTVEQAPPAPITERIPQQKEAETQWIPGYWAYDEEINDFYWVGGIWRRPPPDHQWIPGFWTQLDGGWAWVKGFWSSQPLESITYLSNPPPDQADEDVTQQPGQNYFWNPGYWLYNESTQDFDWLPGGWEESDPNWILVPGHYIWRPQGYVFIAPYWDWPFDRAGTSYSNIYISSSERNITYEPTVIVEPVVIILRLFPYYPNYPYFFWHHYHYYPTFWSEFPVTPPWWNWPTWWSHSWDNQWSLWWWYSHPGYPQPVWLGPEIVNLLPPPPQPLFNLFKRVSPPFIVTPNGVVRPRKFFDEYYKIRGKGKLMPLVPRNKRELDKVKVSIEPRERPSKILRPSGDKEEFKKIHPRMPVKKTDIPSNRVLRKEVKPIKKPERQNIPSKFTPEPQKKDGIKPTDKMPQRPQIQRKETLSPEQQQAPVRIQRQQSTQPTQQQQIQKIEPTRPERQIPQKPTIQQQQQIQRIEPQKPVQMPQRIQERIQQKSVKQQQQQQIQRTEPQKPVQIPQRIQERIQRQPDQQQQQQQIQRVEPQKPIQIPQRIQERIQRQPVQQQQQQQQIQRTEPQKPIQIPQRIQERIQRQPVQQQQQQIPQRIQQQKIERQQPAKQEPRQPEKVQPAPQVQQQIKQEQQQKIQEQIERRKQEKKQDKKD